MAESEGEGNMSNQTYPIVLITGAARRIGAAIATFLHARQYNIIMHFHHSTNAARQLAQRLNDLRPDSVSLVCADLTASEDLSIIEQHVAQQGCLHGLIHNASLFYPTPVAEASVTQWDELFACNVKAPFFLSKLLAPYLADSLGCIVNITDIHGEKPLKDYPIYSMTKAALLMQTQSLARELAPKIRVNAVSPGPTLWPEEAGNMLNEQQRQILIERTVLKRLGHPDNIAQAVWHCLSNDYLTGQVITVDGGRSLR
jgi:pteridine reductase